MVFQVVSKTTEKVQPHSYQQFKLAMVVHAASLAAVRMANGAKPQPPQTFKLAGFPVWVRVEWVTQPLSIG
jgi:hypothetical protein